MDPNANWFMPNFFGGTPNYYMPELNNASAYSANTNQSASNTMGSWGAPVKLNYGPTEQNPVSTPTLNTDPKTPPTLSTPDMLKMGLQGAATLGNLWAAWQSSRLAKDSLNYTKKIGDANLANSTKNYNTNLEAKAALRASNEGWNSEQLANYIAANKL